MLEPMVSSYFLRFATAGGGRTSLQHRGRDQAQVVVLAVRDRACSGVAQEHLGHVLARHSVPPWSCTAMVATSNAASEQKTFEVMD